MGLILKNMIDLNEYCTWMQQNRIRKNTLSQEIGYRYDHTVQVLNGKEKLSEPFAKSLELFRENFELKRKSNNGFCTDRILHFKDAMGNIYDKKDVYAMFVNEDIIFNVYCNINDCARTVVISVEPVLKEDKHQIDWAELREKYFNECVDTNDFGRKVNCAPHDLFEWFKLQLGSYGTKI